jgi:hypothetical protein
MNDLNDPNALGRENRNGNWHVDSVLLNPTGAGGGDLSFPGYEGVPFRGPVPDLKHDDPQHMQPQFGQNVYVKVFNLFDEEQLKQYSDICQMVGNGFAAISSEDRVYDDDIKNWRVFIRWIEFFTYDPKGGVRRGTYRELAGQQTHQPQQEG